jgi:hypothetical protein
MRTMPKIVIALSAFAAIGASAQTVYSGQADQERRERNREEALSHYRDGTTNSTSAAEERERAREKTHEAAQSARRGTHRVAESTRRVTHKSANAVRRVGHKAAVEARESTARVNAKYGPTVARKGRGEAMNPSGTNTTAPNGPKP